jgi:hypothetical protein
MIVLNFLRRALRRREALRGRRLVASEAMFLQDANDRTRIMSHDEFAQTLRSHSKMSPRRAVSCRPLPDAVAF